MLDNFEHFIELLHKLNYTDIDECANGMHSCDLDCENTAGSYSCFCQDSNFVLANDGLQCLGNFHTCLKFKVGF